jgi:hypothetical protein
MRITPIELALILALVALAVTVSIATTAGV